MLCRWEFLLGVSALSLGARQEIGSTSLVIANSVERVTHPAARRCRYRAGVS